MSIQKVEFIEMGTDKYQTNIADSTRGACTYLNNGNKNEVLDNDFRFGLCDQYAYCIDANYAKGISFEQFLKKHRRQLVIEVI